MFVNTLRLPGIIKFNPAKSQLITFGGKTPHDNKMYMNGTAMPWVEKVKYLGTDIWCKSGMSDISSNIRKFYSQFNNILCVLNKSTRDGNSTLNQVILFISSAIWL